MKPKFECEYCGELLDNVFSAERHELTHKPGDDNSFGKRLARARIDRELTQTRLSIISGVPQANIWSYENNKTSPKISTLELLCKALEISASELLGY